MFRFSSGKGIGAAGPLHTCSVGWGWRTRWNPRALWGDSWKLMAFTEPGVAGGWPATVWTSLNGRGLQERLDSSEDAPMRP